jgi:hypothetical protein
VAKMLAWCRDLPVVVVPLVAGIALGWLSKYVWLLLTTWSCFRGLPVLMPLAFALPLFWLVLATWPCFSGFLVLVSLVAVLRFSGFLVLAG